MEDKLYSGENITIFSTIKCNIHDAYLKFCAVYEVFPEPEEQSLLHSVQGNFLCHSDLSNVLPPLIFNLFYHLWGVFYLSVEGYAVLCLTINAQFPVTASLNSNYCILQCTFVTFVFLQQAFTLSYYISLLPKKQYER